jgi:6-methylpretetramide 4-monooxygenase / 4-hydroxy-6-methylpretetramide 12a-monooxygenase
MREKRTEVLVVGAGPVGLWTALALKQQGLDTTIVDQEERVTTRSYACALHPATLTLLASRGVLETLLPQGRKIEKIGFYEGAQRQGEIDFTALNTDHPYLLILPQSTLEGALEKHLHQQGVGVRWNERFEELHFETEGVTATLGHIGGTATGYIVPHWEKLIQKRTILPADFLVGADGTHSNVRKQLGTDFAFNSDAELFATFEFASDQPGPDELRVMLNDETTDVLWPLPNGRYRWTFQIPQADSGGDFPEKERRLARGETAGMDEAVRSFVERVAAKRAPWFEQSVREITWSAEVSFHRRVVREFGRDRCWLAGDAAHQTGPVGVQSMNSGFMEGEMLAAAIKQAIQQQLDTLPRYNELQQQRWRTLLGLSGGLKPGSKTSPWLQARLTRLLPCLPGLNHDLPALVRQLDLTVA